MKRLWRRYRDWMMWGGPLRKGAAMPFVGMALGATCGVVGLLLFDYPVGMLLALVAAMVAATLLCRFWPREEVRDT